MDPAKMYEVDENIRQQVLESFGKTKDTANEDVQEIKEWISTQTQFPEVMEDVMILNFLQLNKFRSEKTKEKIACYYTLRSKIPDFFAESNPKTPKQQRIFDDAYMFNFPNILDGIDRIVFVKTKKPNAFAPFEMTKLFFSFFEIRLLEDCMVKDIIIVDLENFTFRDVTKMTFRLLWNIVSVYKIQVHRDAEVLKAIFSKQDLPKEYGGNGPFLDELNDMMKRKLAMHQDRFDKLDSFMDGKN